MLLSGLIHEDKMWVLLSDFNKYREEVQKRYISLQEKNTALKEENAKLLALIKYQTLFGVVEELNRAKNKLTAIREIME